MAGRLEGGACLLGELRRVPLYAPLWLVKVVAVVRQDPIVLSGRLPTGELAVLSRATLRHIHDDHGKHIRREQILRAIEEPIQILKDGRLQHARRAKIYCAGHVMTPFGKTKSKHFVVHLKPCRIFFMGVFYVSTALAASKLPPKGDLIWARNGEKDG